MNKVLFACIALAPILLLATITDFKKANIKVAGQRLRVELAETEDQQEQGLMYRKSLKEGEGMLFVFPNARVRRFWMKNTFIDLSIGYFDENKALLDVQDMIPVKSEMETNLPVYPSSGPAKYALEVPLGWFKKHKIKPGDKLVLE